jgi:SAM-dependent methyltransferase
MKLKGHLLRGDMRHLPVKERCLSGICMWFTPFGYFSDEENGQLLSSLSRLLKPGGFLVLDFLNAELLRRQLVPEDVVERNGLRVHSRRAIEEGRVVKRMQIQNLETGAQREVTESVRIYTPVELVNMARHHGLQLSQAFGDYAGSDFIDAVSPRWIGLFSL